MERANRTTTKLKLRYGKVHTVSRTPLASAYLNMQISPQTHKTVCAFIFASRTVHIKSITDPRKGMRDLDYNSPRN